MYKLIILKTRVLENSLSLVEDVPSIISVNDGIGKQGGVFFLFFCFFCSSSIVMNPYNFSPYNPLERLLLQNGDRRQTFIHLINYKTPSFEIVCLLATFGDLFIFTWKHHILLFPIEPNGTAEAGMVLYSKILQKSQFDLSVSRLDVLVER